jgi:hypothetical protein
MHQQRDGNHDRDAGAGGSGPESKGDNPTGNPGPEQSYHHGILARDREFDAPLNRRAAKIYRRAQRGEIYLLQRRIAVNEFDYFYRRRA